MPRTAVAQKMKDDNVGDDKCAVMAGQIATPKPAYYEATPAVTKGAHGAAAENWASGGSTGTRWTPKVRSGPCTRRNTFASPFDKSSRDFARGKSAFGERAPIVQSRRSVATAVVEKKIAPKERALRAARHERGDHAGQARRLRGRALPVS